MADGRQYERDTCKTLSKWWAQDDQRDDIFWRSQNSGGRATTRNKGGISTSGQYGDVAATDPSGAKLLQLVTIELKRGYKSSNIHDLLDLNPNIKRKHSPPFGQFLEQTIRSAQAARSYSWLLITRRNSCNSMIWMPTMLIQNLRSYDSAALDPLERVVTFRVRVLDKLVRIKGFQFDFFIDNFKPTWFKRLWKAQYGQR